MSSHQGPISRVKIGLSSRILGFSRQSYYKSLKLPVTYNFELLKEIECRANIERAGCPSRGCRSMYGDFGEHLPIGRDKTIKALFELGYRVRYAKRYIRSTQAGTRPFDNLLVEKDITGINQVWQSDMAYYLNGEKRLYTMYITDVYSQEVVGYGAYDSAHAICFEEVLRVAIKSRQKLGMGLAGLIHHSDGGKQYESHVYRNTCQKHGIVQSMCMYSYENPYAEKTNDIINNGYLNIWKPRTLGELVKQQKKAVENHNTRREKKVLKGLTPQQFRNQTLDETNTTPPYTLFLKPRNPERVRTNFRINT